jgi:hypothetical protein
VIRPHFNREQDKHIPELAAARDYATALHLRGEAYQGQMWGWPVYYEPELVEENALFELPDEGNGMKQEYRRHYSPASFTVGESGIWFFSLLWEDGRDAEPVEFLDVVPVEEANLDATAQTAVAAS